MSHKHANLLHALFQDPPSANIHWREVESLLRHLGADIHPTEGARFRVNLNGVEGMLHHPHHSSLFSRQEIKRLRDYLVSVGIGPDGEKNGGS